MKWLYLAISTFWGLLSAIIMFLMVVDFKWMDLIVLPFMVLASAAAYNSYKHGELI